MLSRVSKGSARPFVDPFNDFTSWNDGRSCLKRGTPLSLTDSLIRQYINPTFSRFLFRASKEKKKKNCTQRENDAFLISLFSRSPSPSRILEKNTRLAMISCEKKKKTRRESRNDLIVETWQESDLRKRRRIRSNRVSWAGFTSLEKKKKKRTAIQFAVRISKRR